MISTITVSIEIDIDVDVEWEEDDDGLPGPSVTGNSLTGKRPDSRHIHAVTLAMSDKDLADRARDEIDRLDLVSEAEDQVPDDGEPSSVWERDSDEP